MPDACSVAACGASGRPGLLSHDQVGGIFGFHRRLVEQARQLVMENTRFAESFGLQGTPAMILGNGVRFRGGYMPAAEIRAFAEANL